MPRYSLRTLLILLAIGPPVLAGAWLVRYELASVCFVIGLILLAALLLGVASAAVLFVFGYR